MILHPFLRVIVILKKTNCKWTNQYGYMSVFPISVYVIIIKRNTGYIFLFSHLSPDMCDLVFDSIFYAMDACYGFNLHTLDK
jgi:hypothetical protein